VDHVHSAWTMGQRRGVPVHCGPRGGASGVLARVDPRGRLLAWELDAKAPRGSGRCRDPHRGNGWRRSGVVRPGNDDERWRWYELRCESGWGIEGVSLGWDWMRQWERVLTLPFIGRGSEVRGQGGRAAGGVEFECYGFDLEMKGRRQGDFDSWQGRRRGGAGVSSCGEGK
jgi:hypothetical protein